tara:strand:- start:32216 stop:34930 length:2715 start_codon:yes stop_codon:yes gene_type:complete
LPAKVRVYELARELDITNKQIISLCGSLGIDAKSHSSSLVEAQADRVRRKAESEGLLKEQAVVEQVQDKSSSENEWNGKENSGESKVPKPVSSKKPPPKKTKPTPSQTKAETSKPVVSSRKVKAASKDHETKAQTAALGSLKDVDKGEEQTPPPNANTPPNRPPLNAPPRSATGKPIPPPPSPRSKSGRPIPPPPGKGGRGPVRADDSSRSNYRARPGGQSTGGPRGQRPGGDRPRGPRPTGGPSTPFFPKPGVDGKPSGGKPGGGKPGGGRPGGPNQRPQRKKKSRRRRRQEELQPMDSPAYTPEDAPVPEGEVVIERSSSSIDVAPKLNRTTADVVRFLMEQGEMVTATQSLTDDMIELFAAEIGAEVRLVDPGEEQEIELQKKLQIDDSTSADKLPERPPVITVMGHVDHGKTKLLDQIRKANIVAGEAGGITQHIGAYQVEVNGQVLTFIDTPGHAAFTAMRARGAEATDIVILVVAADDGVMPQTIEALNHAKAAGVPIIVAVNKIDLESADPQRVLSGLAEHELVPEAWGGETIVVEISALENIGIPDLLENLNVVAEVEDLRATPEGRATGVVLESHLDIGRGPVATVLVQRGTLSVGDPIVAGPSWGRVRALVADTGEQVDSAGPSCPVQVLGMSDVAIAGDEFVVAPDERTARDVADTREHYYRVASIGRDSSAGSGGGRLEDLFSQISTGEQATLNLILKADVNGSLEAVRESIKKLEREEVKVSFVHVGVGAITENDIQLAATSNSTVLGFNVRPDRKAREIADHEQVEIRNYEIIYKLLEDIEAAMVGMLVPEFEEIVTGEAEVREIYRIPRIGAIAGCYVLDGKISRGSKVRFLREGTIIWKGDVSSLRRFKDDVPEVASGYECGIGLSDFQDLKSGDIIETYEERQIEIS